MSALLNEVMRMLHMGKNALQFYRLILSVMVTWLLVCLPVEAEAQSTEAWVELGTHAQNEPDSPALIVLSPLGTGYLHLTDEAFGELTAGGVGTIALEGDTRYGLDDRNDAVSHLSNPYLGIGYKSEAGDAELTFTGGIAVPLAVPGASGRYAFGEGMRGRWDPWLWAPRRLSPVVGVQYHYQIDGITYMSGELGTAAMFWMGEGTEDPRFVLQAAGETGVMLSDAVETAARATFVTGESIGGRDDTPVQLSAEFIGRLYTNDQLYQARLTVPLHAPYGFGFRSGGIWGLHFGAGFHF